MKEIIVHTYQCEVCGQVHDTVAAAAKCEDTPIDTIKAKVGDVVGVGHHGWWNADTSWTVSQLAGKPEWLDISNKDWEKSPPGPFAPVKRAVLPLWKIAAIVPEKGSHRLKMMLWTPRHSNVAVPIKGKDYGEKLTYTYSRYHYTPLTIPAKFHPVLTDAETARYAELVASPPWDKASLV